MELLAFLCFHCSVYINLKSLFRSISFYKRKRCISRCILEKQTILCFFILKDQTTMYSQYIGTPNNPVFFCILEHQTTMYSYVHQNTKQPCISIYQTPNNLICTCNGEHLVQVKNVGIQERQTMERSNLPIVYSILEMKLSTHVTLNS